MYDIETIKAMNRRQGKVAKTQHLEPKLLNSSSTVEDIRSLPNIGDYQPEKWILGREFLVDNSGIGDENEPALTLNQFRETVEDGFGYAIIGVGQFQVIIGEFQYSPNDETAQRRIPECER